MKSTLLAVLAMFSLTACTGFSVENYAVNKAQNYGDKAYNASHILPGVQFKTVELYKSNAFGPSYSYMLLYQCDASGVNCVEVQRNPTTTPGYVAALIAPVIQAGAIVGGAALVGEGLKHSGSNIQNGSSSNSSASSKSKSSSSSSAVGGNATANGGQGGQGGNGGNGGNGNNSVNGDSNPGQGQG